MIIKAMRTHTALLVNKIHGLDFNRQLCKGTLPQSIFTEFARQDAQYLKAFGFALLTTSQKVKSPQHAVQLKKIAEDTIAFEQYVLETFSPRPQPTRFFQPPKVQTTTLPAVAAYIQFLEKTAHECPPEQAIASLLPCFVIYRSLGYQMSKSPTFNSDNPFYDWIKTYTSPSFLVSTNIMLQMQRELGNPVQCQHLRQEMLKKYHTSTHYELRFLQSVYDENLKTSQTNQPARFKL